tara:strand:+ start:2008 stop:2781 length:774 start_codon:yes stop_codon:yes gene_type:complete
MSDLVEDLGDGHFLIIPTGEIKKCSRSTAYRHARKAEKAVKQAEEVQEIDGLPDGEEPNTAGDTPLDLSEETEPLEITSDSYDEITVETPIFDLPSLEDLKKGGEDALEGESFQAETDFSERDDGFIKAIKGAEIVEDDEGNKKVRLADILIGDNPIIYAMLSSCDHALYSWAENKHGMTLWSKESRAVQRKVFVKTLSVIAPKTSIELDPIWVIIGMTGWLYGVPMLRIASKTRKAKKAEKKLVVPYEDQEVMKFE